MKRIVKMRVMFLFAVVFILLVNSCLFYGLNDNIIIAEFSCSFSDAANIVVNGNYLIVGNPADPFLGPDSGFVILDVADPLSVEVAGTYYPPEDVTIIDIESRGNYVYCTTEDLFCIIDISQAAKPVLKGSIKLHNNADMDPLYSGSTDLVLGEADMAFSGFYNLTDTEASCILFAIDCSDVENPVIVSETPVANNSHYGSIEIEGMTVYIATDDNITIFDISDPTAPKQIGKIQQLDTSIPLGLFAVANSVLYVPNWTGNGKVSIIDGGKGSDFSVSAELNDGYLNSMTVYNGILYITGGGSPFVPSIKVYNLTDPLNPVKIRLSGDIDEAIPDFALNENYMYLVTSESVFICTRPGK